MDSPWVSYTECFKTHRLYCKEQQNLAKETFLQDLRNLSKSLAKRREPSSQWRSGAYLT